MLTHRTSGTAGGGAEALKPRSCTETFANYFICNVSAFRLVFKNINKNSKKDISLEAFDRCKQPLCKKKIFFKVMKRGRTLFLAFRKQIWGLSDPHRSMCQPSGFSSVTEGMAPSRPPALFSECPSPFCKHPGRLGRPQAKDVVERGVVSQNVLAGGLMGVKCSRRDSALLFLTCVMVRKRATMDSCCTCPAPVTPHDLDCHAKPGDAPRHSVACSAAPVE